LDEKLRRALSEARLITENRRLKPAIIYMKRGTIIPVDHYRIVMHNDMEFLLAGIGPGRFKVIVSSGYSHRRHWMHRMRDFWAPGQWIPHVRAVEQGWQDETGWSEPDEYGNYDAMRDFELIRKFRKILTMHPQNVAKIEPLPPGSDPRSYEKEPYDDQLTRFRRYRIRGEEL